MTKSITKALASKPMAAFDNLGAPAPVTKSKTNYLQMKFSEHMVLYTKLNK